MARSALVTLNPIESCAESSGVLRNSVGLTVGLRVLEPSARLKLGPTKANATKCDQHSFSTSSHKNNINQTKTTFTYLLQQPSFISIGYEPNYQSNPPLPLPIHQSTYPIEYTSILSSPIDPHVDLPDLTVVQLHLLLLVFNLVQTILCLHFASKYFLARGLVQVI